jgi:hypothetical protein
MTIDLCGVRTEDRGAEGVDSKRSSLLKSTGTPREAAAGLQRKTIDFFFWKSISSLCRRRGRRGGFASELFRDRVFLVIRVLEL